MRMPKITEEMIFECFAAVSADTQRAIGAIESIRANCDALIAMDPEGVIEKALMVVIRVKEREYLDIYPSFRDQALANNDQVAADVYQRVIDSEQQHAAWFRDALVSYRKENLQAV